MAKTSKHSPALFEVVHGRKPFDKTARDSVLRTPSWWFKGRKRMADSGALAPAGTGTALEDPPPFESDIPASVDDPTQDPSFLRNRDRFEASDTEIEHETSAPVDTVAVPAASRSRRRPPFEFSLDRDRHEVFVRARYTTAAVAGVTVVMLLALCYMAGRHTGRSAAAALASATSEDIAAGPVEKGVLDLTRRGGSASGPTTPSPAFTSSGNNANAGRLPATRGSAASPVTTAPLAAAPNQPGRGGAPSEPTVPPAATPESNGKRIVGRQYILVQSYPPEQKKTAEDARDLLAQAGVVCTVEKAPVGWPPSWFSVVGTTGFDRASGAQYQNQMAAIERVNEKFAGKASFKRFDPTPIRWKERAD